VCFKKFLYLVFFFILCGQTLWADNKLVIYTYDSFSSEWGPGPIIKEKFVRTCNCEIEFITTSNAATLLTKILLEKDKTEADIVIGLDQKSIWDAMETGLFSSPHVYDYGYFAFIYNDEKLLNPPKSFEELIEMENIKIITQDPRTSTPGFGLLTWIKYIYGNNSSKVWSQLNKNIITYTPGWSEAYGIFLSGNADLVLSYTTSPAYHMMYENTSKYKALIFSEGHYKQNEYALILENSNQQGLAKKFIEFIRTKDIQKEFALKNIMYPYEFENIKEQLPIEFTNVPVPDKTFLFEDKIISLNKEKWIDEWLNAVVE